MGGAIGDALGWPVEFMKFCDVIREFGDQGITDLICNKSGKAEITDDTQMTIFTAEGLLRAGTRGNLKGICHVPSVVYYAYRRWLYTQGYPKDSVTWIYNSWLLGIKELYERRAPGNSCLSALGSGKMGTIDQPINNSKGCGGVMRVAPVGLLYPKNTAFEIACECAALTHGHPSGYLSAGVFAYIIACLIEGMELDQAVPEAVTELQKHAGHEECSAVVIKAMELAEGDKEPEIAIKILGEGWVGEEAIAIAVYCALKYKNDFRKALCVAVNHDGDSDSTGAITGNILGAYLGTGGISDEWLAKVELFEVLIQLADDLLGFFSTSVTWQERYPGY